MNDIDRLNKLRRLVADAQELGVDIDSRIQREIEYHEDEIVRDELTCIVADNCPILSRPYHLTLDYFPGSEPHIATEYFGGPHPMSGALYKEILQYLSDSFGLDSV